MAALSTNQTRPYQTQSVPNWTRAVEETQNCPLILRKRDSCLCTVLDQQPAGCGAGSFLVILQETIAFPCELLSPRGQPQFPHLSPLSNPQAAPYFPAMRRTRAATESGPRHRYAIAAFESRRANAGCSRNVASGCKYCMQMTCGSDPVPIHLAPVSSGNCQLKFEIS
jgi:hypothetical protein